MKTPHFLPEIGDEKIISPVGEIIHEDSDSSGLPYIAVSDIHSETTAFKWVWGTILVLVLVMGSGFGLYYRHIKSKQYLRYHDATIQSVQTTSQQLLNSLQLEAEAHAKRAAVNPGSCPYPHPDDFLMALDSYNAGNFDRLQGCLLRYMDLEMLGPMISWYAGLSPERQSLLMNPLRRLLARNGNEALPYLERGVNTLQSLTLATICSEMLGLLGNKASIEILVEALRHGDRSQRQAAASALDLIVSSQHLAMHVAFDLLRMLTQDPDAAIRVAAFQALALFKGRAAVELARQGLRDSSEKVKRASAAVLIRLR